MDSYQAATDNVKASFSTIKYDRFSAINSRNYGNNLKNKTIIITGAASGFGREFAIKAAGLGAKVVVSDIKMPQLVIDEIRAAGGIVEGIACNVTSWTEQLALFQFAESKYGAIDKVFANAGIPETAGDWINDVEIAGIPQQPNDKVLQVNLIGVVYTAKLSFHFFNKNPAKDKSLILIASMAGHLGLPSAPLYTAAKHAILGLFRSIYYDCNSRGININCICPWFVETSIIELLTRVGILGLPLAKIDDVVEAIIRSSSDPSFNGNTVIVDAEGCLAVPFEAAAIGGYYKEFNKRAQGGIRVRLLIKDVSKLARILLSRLVKSKKGRFGVIALLLLLARYKSLK